MPERPADVGTSRLGEERENAVTERAGEAPLAALPILAMASRRPIFWLLFGSFLVCGATTNGLIGMHMIAYCSDHGIAPVAAAGLMTVMGVFDLIGTTASGWLTDRYEPKRLLTGYYVLRGVSLLLLPAIGFGGIGMAAFAVIYGLNWVATVPPTLALTNRAFGDRAAPVVFGWIVVGHQIGAALAALGAGVVREAQEITHQPLWRRACLPWSLRQTSWRCRLCGVMARRRLRPYRTRSYMPHGLGTWNGSRCPYGWVLLPEICSRLRYPEMADRDWRNGKVTLPLSGPYGRTASMPLLHHLQISGGG